MPPRDYPQDEEIKLVKCDRCGREVAESFITTEYTGWNRLCMACVMTLGRDRNRKDDDE